MPMTDLDTRNLCLLMGHGLTRDEALQVVARQQAERAERHKLAIARRRPSRKTAPAVATPTTGRMHQRYRVVGSTYATIHPSTESVFETPKR